MNTRQEDTDALMLRRIEEYGRESMKNLRASHGWDHVQRVYALACHIAEKEGADIFIVKAASILHDIGREAENLAGGALCHAERGADMARNFLQEQRLDADRTEQIVHCILTHRYRGERKPVTVEAMAVHDADKLDSIGAVGIGRAFLFSGEVGAKLHNGEVDIHATSAYSEEDTAYREFIHKLRFVRERMLTDEGKRIAEERHAFMEQYFEELHEEVKGNR
jgi:uncharacterized protein